MKVNEAVPNFPRRGSMRILSSLLILLTLISQCLISIPHSHAGTSVVEQDRHSARPHFHVHNHSHDGVDGTHDEKHESHDESPLAPLDGGQGHDSDAVFGSDAWLLSHANSTELLRAELSVTCIALSDSTPTSQYFLCFTRGPTHWHGLHKCPLYLRTRSIRC